MFESLGKASTVACCRRASCRTVIAPGSQDPITGGSVMLLQQCGGHGEISVGIKGFARAGKTLSVVTQVGLPETDIDPLGVMSGECLK